MAKIKLRDVKNAVDTVREVMPIIEPLVREHGPKVVDQAEKIAHQAGNAVDDAKRTITEKIQQHKDGQAQKELSVKARRKLSLDHFHQYLQASFSRTSNQTSRTPLI